MTLLVETIACESEGHSSQKDPANGASKNKMVEMATNPITIFQSVSMVFFFIESCELACLSCRVNQRICVLLLRTFQYLNKHIIRDFNSAHALLKHAFFARLLFL